MAREAPQEMDHIWTVPRYNLHTQETGSDDNVANRTDRSSRGSRNSRIAKWKSVQTDRTGAASLRAEAHQGLSGSDEGNSADRSGQRPGTVAAFFHAVGVAPESRECERIPP